MAVKISYHGRGWCALAREYGGYYSPERNAEFREIPILRNTSKQANTPFRPQVSVLVIPIEMYLQCYSICFSEQFS